MVLGNHDLSLLALSEGYGKTSAGDTLAQVLETRMRLIDLGAQRDSLVARLNSLIAD